MVFFTCNHCGESVKKPAVEKHYNFKCRGKPVNVSCMDCQKDFHGEAYVAHTKCISEAEKYSGKDYVAKESKNSGAKKQESWMDIIRSILETEEYKLTAHARRAFERLQSVDNVPRKKAKFQNFVANCMRMPRGQAEEVWNILEKELEKMKNVKQAEIAAAKEKQQPKAAEEAPPTVSVPNGKENSHVENGINQTNGKKKKKDKSAKRDLEEASVVEEAPAAKKSKKQKTEEVVETTQAAASAVAENDSEEQQEFAWSVALKKIVDKHADGIALEKLKKKLLKKYTGKLGLTVAELTEKQQKKFEKKFTKNLKKCSDLQVTDDVVKSCC